jgi:putative flippase GtrA
MSWAARRSTVREQFARFLLAGCANSIVGLSMIYLTKWVLNFHDIAANATGYIFGFGVSFVVNKAWTFSYSGPASTALVKYTLVFLFAYGVNLATVLILIEAFQLNSYLGQACGLVPYTLTFFFLSRALVFRCGEGRRSDRAQPSVPRHDC